MYEARQNKEKVSRRIDGDGMARQRLKIVSPQKRTKYMEIKNCIIQKINEPLNFEDYGIAHFLVYQYHNSQKKCRKVDLNVDNIIHFGAELILLFEPKQEFGNDGDHITFINVLLKDSFSKKVIGQLNKLYTWNKNESLKKLYQASSQMTDFQQVLNGPYIDQNPDGHDPRYIDINRDELEAIELIRNNKIKEIEEFFGKEQSEILTELRHENSGIKHIPYNAQKKDGAWKPARFTDEPDTFAYSNSTVDGGQTFELSIIYEPFNGNKMRIGTIVWGWYIKEEKKAKDAEVELINPISVEGQGHLQQAISNWNTLMDPSNTFSVPADVSSTGH